VDKGGKLAGIDYADATPIDMQRAANKGLYDCRFRPLVADGAAVHYHVQFSFTAP